jgi:hypothetical protein
MKHYNEELVARPVPASASMRKFHSHNLLMATLGFTLFSLLPVPSHAVPMKDDPKGFEGIPWGAAFSETADFALVEKGRRVQGYELKQGPPSFGPAKIDSMRFVTIDGQFGRVTIRYHGLDTHRQIVEFLESKHGALDRTPGQIAGKAVKQGSWRGEDTEISFTFDSRTDRGIIFVESRSLATTFADGMAAEPDHLGATY